MWTVAVRTCGDREMASDAIQDGFLAAFRRAGQYRGDAAVTTWLHRIVVNACLPGPSAAPQAQRTAARGHPQRHPHSTTPNTRDTLPDLARALLANPADEVSLGAAESPGIGPLATTTGAAACVCALGQTDALRVSIDLGTYAGQPAAVVAVERPDGDRAFAVQRDCSASDPKHLQDAVPVG